MRSNTTRAAIYVRISEDRDDQQLGVERQRQDCLKLCADRGWDAIEPVYEDNDISASKGKLRASYQRLLADIRAGRVDAVVAFDQDRTTRTPMEFEQFALDVWQAGIPVLSTVVSGDIPLGPEIGRAHV